LIKLLMGQK